MMKMSLFIDSQVFNWLQGISQSRPEKQMSGLLRILIALSGNIWSIEHGYRKPTMMLQTSIEGREKKNPIVDMCGRTTSISDSTPYD